MINFLGLLIGLRPGTGLIDFDLSAIFICLRKDIDDALLLFSETGHLRTSLVIAVSGPTDEGGNPCFAYTVSELFLLEVNYMGCPGEKNSQAWCKRGGLKLFLVVSTDCLLA